METRLVPPKPVPSRKSSLALSSDWKTLNLGRVLQEVLPVLADYKAFKPEAANIWWPARNVNYGSPLVLVPSDSRSNMYLTFQLRRGDDRGKLVVRRLNNRVFDWSLGSSRYLTFTLDGQGTPNNIRGILWLMDIISESIYRNGSSKNLDNWGTQDIGNLVTLRGKSLEYVLKHVGPKWWPFCEAIWKNLPNALMPVQVSPLVAAYYCSKLQHVRVGTSSSDFAAYFGPEGRMNDLIRYGARKLTYTDHPSQFPVDEFGTFNSNPALVMFQGVIGEDQFWARRKRIMEKGYMA